MHVVSLMYLIVCINMLLANNVNVTPALLGKQCILFKGI